MRHRRWSKVVRPLIVVAVVLVAGCRSEAGQGTSSLLSVADHGLFMNVTLEAVELTPGGNVKVTVTLRNDRPAPVLIGTGGWDCGGVATMSGGLTLPLEPAGRNWDGILEIFKRFALAEGQREGGSPIGQPWPTYASRTGPCLDSSADFVLAPGATATDSMLWSAQLVPGVPARPGTVRITVRVDFDPADGGTSPTVRPGGLVGMRSRIYQRLAVEGTLKIVGEAPPILSAAQAIDVLLAEQRFSAWLTKLPPDTWSGANVFLQHNDQPQGIVPAGPVWEIDLFREMGVPRNWAIGFVDANSGRLLNLTLCDAPCDL